MPTIFWFKKLTNSKSMSKHAGFLSSGFVGLSNRKSKNERLNSNERKKPCQTEITQ